MIVFIIVIYNCDLTIATNVIVKFDYSIQYSNNYVIIFKRVLYGNIHWRWKLLKVMELN